MKQLIIVFSVWSAFFCLLPAENIPSRSQPDIMIKFQSFSAKNLNDVVITVPDPVSPRVEVAVLTFARQDLEQTDSWINTFTSLYKGNTNPVYCEVAVTGDIPVIGGLIFNGIKNSLPKDKWDRFLIFTGDKEKLSKNLMVDNAALFYIYVIGRDGTIKWSLKAPLATDALIKEMLNAVKKELSY